MFVAPTSGGKWEAALQLLELMPSEGVRPDLMTYNIALDACVKVRSIGSSFLSTEPTENTGCGAVGWLLTKKLKVGFLLSTRTPSIFWAYRRCMDGTSLCF